MSKQDEVIGYIQAHPGSTNRDIAEGLNRHIGPISATTSYLENIGRLSSVSRAKAGTRFTERLYTFRSSVAARSYAPKKTLKKVPPKPVNPVLSVAESEMLRQVITAPVPTVTTPNPAVPEPEAPSLDGMVDALAQHIANQLLPLVYKYLMAKMPTTSVLNRTPQIPLAELNGTALDDDISGISPTPKKRLPKVAVLGLLASQTGHIQMEFGRVFDLEFWNTSDGDNRLANKTHNARMVFVHTNHMGHNVTEQLKSAGVPYKLVGGGMSQLREFLKAYYAEIKQ